MKKLLEEARKMIRINSVTANGNEELANYVQGLMQERGFKAQLQQVTHAQDHLSKRQFNVIGVMGDPLVDRKIRKGILLNTHLDTVSPGILEKWTETGGDPFNATIKDGKIFGLGSGDVKLDFLCKLHAAAKFREKKLKMPIYLVGTCGEEVGMFGVKYLIKSGALNPKFVLVGEPSELRVVYAHKCMDLYRVSVGYQQVERDARGFNRKIELQAYGKSAHGSYPELGTNAIEAAIDFLQTASDHGFELRFTRFDGGDTVNKVPDRATVEFYVTSHQFEDFKRFFREVTKNEEADKQFKVELGGLGESGVRFLPDPIFPCLLEISQLFRKVYGDFKKVRDESYNPAHSTVNLGRLQQAPGKLDLHLDLRLLPDLSIDQIEGHLKAEIAKIAARYPSLNVTGARDRMNPGLNMTLDHELVHVCQAALKDAEIPQTMDKKATSTEAAQYFQAGYEAVVFGPGRSHGNSHSPNESNLLEHLEKATLFYEKVIERVCQ